MSETVLVTIGLIVIVGVGAQWLASLLRIPSIVLLLACGMLAGPGLGWIEPRAAFGDALFPTVTIAVGILLFDGGLGLKFRALPRGSARVILRLTLVGAGITTIVGGALAIPLFHVSRGIGILIGAIVVVSGPTVVGPLLRLSRPRDPAATILRWEGIAIDPVGATIGISVLSVVLHENSSPIADLVATAAVGIAIGLLAAGLLTVSLRSYLIPDDLEVAVGILFAVGALVLAESLRSEAGLFAATATGVAMANQRFVPVEGIRVFGHTLGPLILGSLFVTLGAMIVPRLLVDSAGSIALFVAGLVLVVRPLVAYVATLGLRVPARHRILIGAMAPRGIVAAATAALYGDALAANGLKDPVVETAVYGTILGTVVLYGVLTPPLVRALKIARPPARGILLFGDEPWMRDLSRALADCDVPVLLVGRAWRGDPDPAYAVHAGSLSELREVADLEGFSHAIVLESDLDRSRDAAQMSADLLGRRAVFRLPPMEAAEELDPDGLPRPEALARTPFGHRAERAAIADLIERGANVETWVGPRPPPTAPAPHIPLIRVDADGKVHINPPDRPLDPGDRLIVLTAGPGQVERP
jgi:NhaP-type Na+/H+ or K+/H+ antiporter